MVKICLLLLMGGPFLFGQDYVEKTYCASSVGHQNVDELRKMILYNAKKAAVGELFGEMISSFAKVESGILTEDSIRGVSVGLVRVQGSPVFYNGESFGDACVKIRAFVTSEDREKFKPFPLEKKYCLTEPALTTRELKEQTRQDTIIKALVDHNRSMIHLGREDALALVHQVEYLHGDFVPETETYCVKIRGVVYPIELIVMANRSGRTQPVRSEVQRRSGKTYSYNFEEEMTGSPWTNLTISKTPVGDNHFLGEFGNGSIGLKLKNLGGHSKIRISWDLYILRSWDGDSHGDTWSARVEGGPTLVNATFSNGTHQTQSFPTKGSIGRTGASHINVLGIKFRSHESNAVYPMEFTFPHKEDQLMIHFAGSKLQSLDDESWGLDNVVITLLD